MFQSPSETAVSRWVHILLVPPSGEGGDARVSGELFRQWACLEIFGISTRPRGWDPGGSPRCSAGGASPRWRNMPAPAPASLPSIRRENKRDVITWLRRENKGRRQGGHPRWRGMSRARISQPMPRRSPCVNGPQAHKNVCSTGSGRISTLHRREVGPTAQPPHQLRESPHQRPVAPRLPKIVRP